MFFIFDLSKVKRIYQAKKVIVAEKKKKDTNYMLTMGDSKIDEARKLENTDIKDSILAAHEALGYYKNAFGMFKAKQNFTMMDEVRGKINKAEEFLKKFTQDEIDSALVFNDADSLRNSSKERFDRAKEIRNTDRRGSIWLCLDALSGLKNALEYYSKNDSENAKHVESKIAEIEAFLKRFADDEIEYVRKSVEEEGEKKES